MPKFSKALFDTICERIAEGESLRSICKDKDMPAMSAVFKWLAKDGNEKLVEQYARARETQADALADEILNIADDSGLDVSVDEKGKYKVDGEAIQRANLRIDARKWLAGKMRPKKYGDRTQMELSGPNGGAIKTKIQVNVVDPKR